MEAKKSLGQNFFVNKHLGEYILNILKETKSKHVIEIGPGTGFFTNQLLSSFNSVTVVEKDNQLATSLSQQYNHLQVINKDFLELNIDEIYKDKDTFFFGSLPFNVSKPIIRKIIESKYFTKPAFFIVQKEVADKYLYKEPYSVLSLTTAIYASCKKILDISPESFRPKPKVNSSLITFTPNFRNVDNRRDIEELIATAFKQPRKNLSNNLKHSKYIKGISEFKTLRPQVLSLDDYIQIYKYSL